MRKSTATASTEPVSSSPASDTSATGVANAVLSPLVLALAALIVLLISAALSANTEINAAVVRGPATLPSKVVATSGSPFVPSIAVPPLGLSAVATAAAAPTTQPAVVPGSPAEPAPVAQPKEVAPAAATRPAAWDTRLIKRGSEAPATKPTTQPAAAQGVNSTSYDVGRVAISLAAVLALIFFLKWGGKKVFALPSSNAGSVMQVVSRTPLAPRQQLLLVRVGRRMMVIGDSGGRLSGLSEITDPDEVASLLGQSQAAVAPAGPSISFTSMFRRFGGQRNTDAEADWDELRRDPTDGLVQERSGLFGTKAPIGDVIPQSTLGSGSLDEVEAEKAVEAARYDIQALRAKLREVTGRLTTDSPAGNDKTSDAA